MQADDDVHNCKTNPESLSKSVINSLKVMSETN